MLDNDRSRAYNMARRCTSAGAGAQQPWNTTTGFIAGSVDGDAQEPDALRQYLREAEAAGARTLLRWDAGASNAYEPNAAWRDTTFGSWDAHGRPQ